MDITCTAKYHSLVIFHIPWNILLILISYTFLYYYISIRKLTLDMETPAWSEITSKQGTPLDFPSPAPFCSGPDSHRAVHSFAGCSRPRRAKHLGGIQLDEPRIFIMEILLVDGWPTPLQNMSSSVGATIPNMMGTIIQPCSKPPTRLRFDHSENEDSTNQKLDMFANME